MNAIIIDDEQNSSELLCNMLNLYCPTIEILGTAESVQSGFAAINQLNPDIVFLDIQMGDGTGFDLLSLFESVPFHVIFTTAYQEYAVQAFQYSAVDYLLKPISPEYLVKAVNKVQKLNHSETEIQTLLGNFKQPEDKKIVVKTHDRIYSIHIKDIVRCESDSSYTTLYLEKGHKIVVAKQLKEFDEMLCPNDFLRTHQSHLVNLNYVFYYQKGNKLLIMKDESAIPVSAKKKDELISFIASK